MYDERAPEPCMCGDPACPVCGAGRESYLCDAARATAAREWDEMSGAIAKQMVADACRRRWIAGAVRYGREWQSEERDNVDEAREELLDAINYFLAAGARGQLSTKHAGSFVQQVVELLYRLDWVQSKFGREEAGADG
jgi:hypothetical protein